MKGTKKEKIKKQSFIEKVGKKIPDPVIIFMSLYVIVFAVTLIAGGTKFETLGADGGTVAYEIKNMFVAENFRWIFDNALLTNWLGYGGGVLGTILIVMLGVGIAEESGLLGTLIKKVGLGVSDKFLPVILVFLGIMSSIASDAGYLVLIPLAGMLYVGLKKNPLIGMAAAFAGVSAGFSANLFPSTPSDIIVGNNAKIFAESQNIPFVSNVGQAINPATMNYVFIFVSTILLSIVGYFITVKFVKPRLENESYLVPEDFDSENFTIKPEENKALFTALIGLVIALLVIFMLHIGPLAPYINEKGASISPIKENIILFITFAFLVPGLFFGIKMKKFSAPMDVVKCMTKQMGGMGYILVLTFFSYNFLALLSYSNVGTYITYLGATLLQNLGIQDMPIVLLIGFILVTAIINLFVGGLTSKWMLLGPIFIPMLYQVNPDITPELVTAAYRLADSSTNVISPLMSYAGVILVFMRKYKPEYTLGDMIRLMTPYSIGFLICWTILLVIFILGGIPLGI